jgi:hypothetical protein
VNYLLAAATLLLAVWKGGWRERAIAGVQLLQVLLAYYVCRTWACPEWRPLADDAVMLAVCLACAVRGDRYWTIPASSFALLAVATDGAILAGVAAPTAAWADLVWMYLLSAAILWGVFTAQRAQRSAA